MKILFCGDVVGRSGRRVALNTIPKLKEKCQTDFVIVNIENAAGGFGVTQAICEDFFAAGCDVLTSGNHIWDQKETRVYINKEPRLLRPHNYAEAPGQGLIKITHQKGFSLLVVNLMGRLLMPAKEGELSSPFEKIDEILKTHPLKSRGIDGIFVDFHAETTSEKYAFGHYVDGRVSAVIGTHTHVPTDDLGILPQGTAYQTDTGMCGDYNSVIGMKKELCIERFLGNPSKHLLPALGSATLRGALIDLNPATGLASKVIPVCCPE